ncbi:MAG: Asd/ArgC dimerization domain-containing protein [Candidatus Aminicenantales bacterium]
MAAPQKKKLCFALVGSETLRGREIRSVLGAKKFPLKSLEFYDPDVEEEFSKLTQFRDEPKVVHHLDRKALTGLDLVFLASDPRTNTEYGECAAALGYRAIDLAETFNDREEVPLIVSGVNDAGIRRQKFPLIANPNPVTIILSHLLHALDPAFGIAKALAFVLEPVSIFEEAGIQELADQSFALLSGSPVPKKFFHDQVAFNILSRTEKAGRDGYSAREARILAEVRRVLAPANFPLSLSIVLAPVFHTYSIMIYVELKTDAAIADLEAAFRGTDAVELTAAGGPGLISAVSVAGKDKVFVGQIKKADSVPGGFWIWAVADNLTLGSAHNAYGIARSLFKIT